MRILLILSLFLNMYFQFKDDIFDFYVDEYVCKGKGSESRQSSETYWLRIPYLVESSAEYPNPECRE